MADDEQALHPAAPGDVIAGKYRIDGVLGKGGMGIVFAATHLHLERRVAVKVMRTELAEFPGAVQRLVLEAKLAARLRSEHVCKVLDVGTLDDGAPYVVMEYLEGADLASLLSRQGAFPTATAVDFIMEACEALAEAHAAQIVHRDLKPENLFVARALDGTSTIKVLDFGISKQRGQSTGATRNLTNPASALGSPNYMPPEQMRAPRDVDARADLWAIGAILYELLTGRQAFAGESLPEVCAKVMDSVPTPAQELRADLPPRLVEAVNRCLEKEPMARFADVSELAAALAPFGSAAAPASLLRIERVLSGAHAPTVANSNLPQVVTPFSRPVTPRVSEQPTIETKSPTITTGAAVALLGSGHGSRRPLLIVALLALLGTAGALVLAEYGTSGSASVPVPPPVSVVAAARPTVEPTPEPSTTEEPEGAVVATSAEPPHPHSERANAPPVARHAPRAPRAPAVAASPAPAATPAAVGTGAWDPNSFGPRR